MEKPFCYLQNGLSRIRTLLFYLVGSMSFHIPAAHAPPTNGPTMKIQRFARAVPPWKIAGAIERAGFTDVPV